MHHHRVKSIILPLLVVVGSAIVGLPLLGGSIDDGGARFHRTSQLPNGPADWLATDGNRVAFGTGSQVYLGSGLSTVAVSDGLELTAPVVEAALLWNRLYLNHGDRIGVLDLDSRTVEAAPFELGPTPRGTLHLARMNDYLIVTEDGVGLRLVFVAPPHGVHPMPGRRHVLPKKTGQIAFLPMADTFTAVAATAGRFFYAATAHNGIAMIDLANIYEPVLVRYLQIAGEVLALTASGRNLYVLGHDGLSVWVISDQGSSSITGHFPEVRGEGIQVLGRTVQVVSADGGLETYQDQLAGPVTVPVAAGDFFFNPQNISINVGDQVAWSNPGGGFHNVRSCIAGEPGCSGQIANESFLSNGPPFTTLNHTFVSVGSNPYVCQPHAVLNMVGSVTVTAPALPPPGVPDGTIGTPLTVAKLLPSGNRLRLTFDTASCTPNGHDVLFGTSAQLPNVVGDPYGLTGGVCAIGGSPFNWLGVPVPAVGDYLWFLVVADDGNTEGSWGKDSAGNERDGIGAGGASNQCGNTAKDLANACGQ